MSGTKEEAFAFLQGLAKALVNSGMPKGVAMNAEVRRIVDDAKKDERKKHLRLPEAAFLNSFAVPVLFEYLQTHAGLSKAQAREALLNEYHRSMPEMSAGSPIFPQRHPFQKFMSISPSDIYRNWYSPKKGDGLTQSAPDFALRAPFPHSIVFEGKFYASGSPEYGARQLATDLYQAFFYKGLPRTAAHKKKGASWDYDFSCLLAFDASKDGTLLGAWEALRSTVRRAFWESANIFVMILRD